MNTCKTCKWWRGHICTCRKLDDGVETVNGMQILGDIRDVSIYTGPDFGCVHHEPKE